MNKNLKDNAEKEIYEIIDWMQYKHSILRV